MPQNTLLPTTSELEAGRKWHFFDADGRILGRFASRIAILLMGKHKRNYTLHMDCGDFVVVTNAAKIKVTGNKAGQKFYFRHSGYASGKKVIPFERQMQNDPRKVIHLAVRRMLDDNKLRSRRMKRLKIFTGAEHSFTQPAAAKLTPVNRQTAQVKA